MGRGHLIDGADANRIIKRGIFYAQSFLGTQPLRRRTHEPSANCRKAAELQGKILPPHGQLRAVLGDSSTDGVASSPERGIWSLCQDTLGALAKEVGGN